MAFNTRLDSEMLKASYDNIMNSLTKPHLKETCLAFHPKKLEDRFDESFIDRVVTTLHLIDILKTDEFADKTALCLRLLGKFTVTHYLYIQADVIHDTDLEDDEIQWTPDAFIEYYPNSLWRILD